MKVHATAVLPRPLEEAFTIVHDLETWFPQVDEDILSVTRTTDGETGIGTRFDEVVKGPFGELLFVIELTRFDPPEEVGFTSTGPILVAEGVFTCTPSDGGTQVTLQFTARPRRVGWLLFPVLAFTLQGIEQRRLDKLAALVAAGAFDSP